MNKKNFVISIVVVTAIMIICGVLVANWIKVQKLEEYAAQQEKIQLEQYKALTESSKLKLSVDPSIDLLDGLGEVEIILSTDEILKKVTLTSGYKGTASATVSTSVVSEMNMLYGYSNMVTFVAYTDESAAKLEFSADMSTTTYSITKTPTAFYIPIKNYNEFAISLVSEFQPTHIVNLALLQYPSDSSAMKLGQYELSEVEKISLDEMSVISDKSCNSVLTDDNFIYAFFNSDLVIYEKTDTGYNQISELEKPGTCTQMEFLNDSVLVVTSRENDVFFIDISDVKNPFVLSTYDSLDLACGLSASDDYVFLCSRYYGVEIIDVTEPDAPKLCSIINTGGECLDCCINDNYLYISNWNLQLVSVYNIENPNKPEFVCEIETDGNPYGIECDGKNIFVATGHHSRGLRSKKTDGGYGGGHGMEIYNIEKANAPRWVSTVKIDGKLYYPQIDSWGVYLNGNYAFLSSTYGGVYIYDISDVSNPLRIGKIAIEIQSNNSKYTYVENTKNLFPYDYNQYIIDPVSSISFGDSICYFSCASGLLTLSLDYVAQNTKQRFTADLKRYDGSYFDSFNSIEMWDAKTEVYNNHCFINAVDFYKNYVILACGDNGIEILDSENKVINSIPTPGPVQDVLVYNDIVFVAEGNYGLESYKIYPDGKLTLLGTYRCDLFKETMTHLQITASGKHLIVQDGMAKLKILNVAAPADITLLQVATTGIGSLYRRNLIVSNEHSDVIGVATSDRIILYSDKNGTLERIGVVQNSIYGEHNGICHFDGNFYGICKNGYVKFTRDDIENSKNLISLPVYKCEQVFLSGKVSSSDKYLVVCNAVKKNVTILNIENDTEPVLVANFTVDGNPEIAKIAEDKIYIPLRAQGLLIIDLKN